MIGRSGFIDTSALIITCLPKVQTQCNIIQWLCTKGKPVYNRYDALKSLKHGSIMVILIQRLINQEIQNRIKLTDQQMAKVWLTISEQIQKGEELNEKIILRIE